MELQEEMFALVSGWTSAGFTKKAFLSDKPIGLPKFNYCCSRYNGQHQYAKLPGHCDTADFHELLLNDPSTDAPAKVFELTTPSGLRITVFE